ncbi:MAG: magnetosome magnetite formation protein MamP [Alphaproteobacteria bacterium]
MRGGQEKRAPLALVLVVSLLFLDISGGWAAGMRTPQIPADTVHFGPPPQGGAGATTEPPNYVPRTVQVFEAHWQGLDGRLLTGEIRRKLRFPDTLRGVLVGEVTLNAAASGVLAGDVIVMVENQPVATVEEFQRATRLVKDRREARLTVMRKRAADAAGGIALSQMTLVLRGEPDLGFAQVEGAPMILPGAERPHSYRGACTNCHAVGRGFELTPDPDLITLPPAPITADVATRGMRPHEDRGPCEACHVILR